MIRKLTLTLTVTVTVTIILTAAAIAAPAPAPAPAQTLGIGIVITELHRDPAAGNKNVIPGGYSHSFVELTNFGSDTFFIKDLFLTNGKTVDTVMLWGADAPVAGHEECVFDANYIPPGGTAVILPQSYPEALAIAPASIHPIAPGTIMLTVNRRNIGGGLANDDGVAVYRGTRSQIDSLVDLAADPGVYVSAPLSGKIVLSQRQPKGVSVVPVSLLLGDRRYIVSPKDPLTPGAFESLQSGVYVEYAANISVAANAVRCTVAGVFVSAEAGGASWRLYSQSASGGVSEIDRGVFGAHRQFLLVFDIAIEQRGFFFEIRLADGKTVTFPLDLSSFWAAAGTLAITEIYPKGGTAAAAGQPEWFELKNVSPAEVNLNGWMFGNSKDTAVIAVSDFFLPPGGYAVITKDAAAMQRVYRAIEHLIRPARWHTLNSFNDTLVVWSPHGVEVDKAVYRNVWFSGWKAQSLERVFGAGADSLSWVLCDRPTPGLPGGAGLWRTVSKPALEIGPVPFSPNGDGIDDALSIRMQIPPGAKAKIRIFGFDGKLLKTFTGERETILWDGLTDAGRPAPAGAIYVVAEFTPRGGSKRTIRKNGVLWR